ncbi:MAG: sterol-binding protein [Actinomycetota bacterium]|nr:sterol-binding protein [Actinomycetota bacterium]
MATLQECQAAIDLLVQRLETVDPEVRSRYIIERTVSCSVYDLSVVFVGRLCDEGLRDVGTDLADRAQIRVSVSSDDLVALITGALPVTTAWATGRLRVQAGPLDLLKLRQFL